LDDISALDLGAVKVRFRELERQLLPLLERHPPGYGRAIDDALETGAGLLGFTAELEEFRALKALLTEPAVGSAEQIWPGLT